MSKKICVILLVLILLVVGGYFWRNLKNKDSKIIAEDNSNTSQQVKNSLELSQIPFDYTIEDAANDECVTIQQNGVVTNKDKLDLFFENAKNGISGKIRIVEEYGEKNIAITDASFDGENLSISYDYSRSSESNDGIIKNNYSASQYYLLKEEEKLESGNSVMLYKIINKEKSDDVYYLTGYVIYDEPIE